MIRIIEAIPGFINVVIALPPIKTFGGRLDRVIQSVFGTAYGYKRGCLISFLIYFLILPLASHAAETAKATNVLTLDEALRIATEKNRDILKAREYYRWVQGKYLEERAAAFPQLSLNGSGSILQDKTILVSTEALPDNIKSYSAQLEVSQTLFTWGKVGSAIRAAKEGFKVADEQLRLYRQAALRDVSIAFYEVLLSKELHAIALQNLEQKGRHYDEARRKLTAGVATDYDVLAAQVAVENARPDSIRAQNQIRDSLDRLKFLLAIETEGLDVTGKLEAAISPSPAFEIVYETAIENRPEVLDLRHRLNIGKELVKIAGAEDKPRLEFKGAYGWKGLELGDINLNGKAWNAGLFFTFPFFDGFRTKGKVSQRESDLESLRIDEAKLSDSIALQGREALNAVSEAKEIVSALSGTVAQAEKLLSLSEKGYELGVKTRLEVEDAELKLRQARGNLSRAWRDYRAARVNLLWVMGVLGEKEGLDIEPSGKQ